MDVEGVSDEILMLALPEQLEALDALYNRHSGVAMWLAMRVLGDREMAEDVVHDAFLTLWRRAPTYKPGRGSVRNWLLAIVHHRAIDYLRQRSKTTPLPGESGASETAIDVWMLAAKRLDRAALRRALAELSAEQREVIDLAYFRGLTQAQIASALDLPLGTVKGRMRLALGRLRRLLHDVIKAEQ